MRIDKYLWCVRFFKARSLATTACRQGKVRMNEAIVKPSREIFPGEKISVRKNQIDYLLEVLDIPTSRVGAKLVNLYMIDLTPKENLEKLDLLNFSKAHYRKTGTGRPTKKDRRDIEDFTSNPKTSDEEE
ncbi:MAG TPA: RNA-binding S4 domain-containing protein [Flavobacteriaceae bacterium]|nr:RNA-binding S4 domain-containing protein [Flavobacteriaceae bacterium]